MSDGADARAERLRIDRWLWCARLFKSRSAAAEAVRGGRVRLNGQRVKPAHAVKIGDAVAIELPHGSSWDLAIASLPVRRGPAAEAAQTYVETAASVERRRRAAAQRAMRVFTPPTPGKPDKRTRRLLLRARQRA